MKVTFTLGPRGVNDAIVEPDPVEREMLARRVAELLDLAGRNDPRRTVFCRDDPKPGPGLPDVG